MSNSNPWPFLTRQACCALRCISPASERELRTWCRRRCWPPGEIFISSSAGTNCRAWLFRILKNFYSSQLRRNLARTEISLEINEFGLSVPEKITAGHEVREAFSHLTPEHREVLQLASIDGFAISEIATILEIPAGTVASRLNRARLTLRSRLQKRATAGEKNT